MRLREILFFLSLLLVACTQADTEAPSETEDDRAIFSELSSFVTGVTFRNDLSPNLNTLENLFDFDYYYNGAGVGIADINNDGLQDLFFCGNQQDNKLYLNQGDLKFKDITENSGINKNKKWSNGVTFVDLNADGHIDIYVTQGGPYHENLRQNLLFINQGDLTFKEEALAYGLADKGIGTQSAFADFDDDGDLDCIVMNEAELYGYGVEQFLQKAYSNKETLIFNSSHVYENRKGKFHDVSEETGILTPSFGLGLLVSDYNDDGLPDIYMANDYFLPDRLYINKGGFEFEDRHKAKANQMSFFGMGADAGDINNDGHEDIFVLDMASNDHYRSKTLMASMNVDQFRLLTEQLDFGYQYMFNSLLLNDGNNNYNNIAHMAGVGLTDWSWAGLIEDYDLDGYNDIFVTNGYRKYGTDNDFKNKVLQAKTDYAGKVPIEIKDQLYSEMPEEKMRNVLFLNDQKLRFSNLSSQQSGFVTKTFSNGAASGDLDNDGDIDLVVNNIDDIASILENKSNRGNSDSWIGISFSLELQDRLPKVTVYAKGKILHKQIKRTRGYMSACQPMAHFGIEGNDAVDSIKIVVGKRSKTFKDVKLNQTLQVNSLDKSSKEIKQPGAALLEKKSIGDLKLFAKHKENVYDDFRKEILLPYKQGANGPFIKKLGAVNSSDQLIFGNSGLAKSTVFDITEYGVKENIAATTQLTGEISAAAATDLNKDGKIDYVIGTGDNSENENSDTYLNYILMSDGEKYTKQYLPGKANTGAIAVGDFDNDGFEDIIIGNRIIPQKYPIAAPSQYYKNNKGLLQLDESKTKMLATLGIVNELVATDINKDGLTDLVVAAEWEPIRIFINNHGSLEELDLGLSDMRGWWFSAEEIDINNDGLPDFVFGNLGDNTKYHASKEKPLKIFADDFDASGSLDIVLSKKYKDEYVPLRGKECSSQQMPFVSEKFETYDLFAKASLEDVYGSMDSKYQKEVTEFRHLILINKGNNKFEHKLLLQAAQITPFLSMAQYDLNNDGYQDIIAGGNIYTTEAETPRLDYNSLIFLISNGRNDFEVKLGSEYGLTLSGEAKSLEIISNKKGTYLTVGINNSVPELYKINNLNF